MMLLSDVFDLVKAAIRELGLQVRHDRVFAKFSDGEVCLGKSVTSTRTRDYEPLLLELPEPEGKSAFASLIPRLTWGRSYAFAVTYVMLQVVCGPCTVACNS